MAHPKVQFCPQGHDTFICGREQYTYQCSDCKKEYQKRHTQDLKNGKEIEHRTFICPKGHDKRITGIDKYNHCKLCRKHHQDEVKEIKKEYDKNYRQIHKDEIKEYLRTWIEEHPESIRISKLKCQTNRNLRVVAWGQEGMKEFYTNMPDDMTEEHIIPLQGDLVSGLHVIWNLDYLSLSANCSKGNKCTPIEATKFYEKILIEARLKE